MRFFKKNNVYKVIIMTGNYDNYLGISFSQNNNQNIEVIEIPVIYPKAKKNLPSKDEVLNQVIAGLESINQELETDYKLSHIYYAPYSDGPVSRYQFLIRSLIIHYHDGNEFIS